jgi:hypothetical protein
MISPAADIGVDGKRRSLAELFCQRFRTLAIAITSES